MAIAGDLGISLRHDIALVGDHVPISHAGTGTQNSRVSRLTTDQTIAYNTATSKGVTVISEALSVEGRG